MKSGKMMKITFAVLLMACMYVTANAQPCKGLVKSNNSKLAPFTYNGQMNTAYLAPGESIEFQSAYNRGVNYRIMIAGDNLPGIYFKVYDADHRELYSSKDSKNPTVWEFNIEETQDLVIEVFAPKTDGTVKKNTCVALLIGFKLQPAGGSKNLR
jgi:hypothetical protein